MNRHLSEDQIARCIVGEATIAEAQHVRECPECGAELNRFSKSVAQFQSSIRERINDRIALVPSVAVSRPYSAGTRIQRWVLVAAVAVILVVLPFIRTGNKPKALPEPAYTEADPDAVMNRVNLHLSRTVPAPMEPLMLGLPDMNP
jgi:anti-sigma factor RsiW